MGVGYNFSPSRRPPGQAARVYFAPGPHGPLRNWIAYDVNRGSPSHHHLQCRLAACCERWLTLPFVAMDTEFLRTETYFPIAGLIQVGDGCTSSLIDPLAISDWSP